MEIFGCATRDGVAGDYATDGNFTISCADATAVSTEFTSVTRTANTCNYSVVAKATASDGAATFTIPYTSTGGDTHNGIITITITSISFMAPTGSAALKVVAGQTLTINAGNYASEPGFTISCSDATSVSDKFSSVTRTANTCVYEITAKASSQGMAAFTVPYSSTSVSDKIAVQRTGCSYEITAKPDSTGTASFTVPYTSTGGDTHNGTVTLTITTDLTTDQQPRDPEAAQDYPTSPPPSPIQPTDNIGLRWNFLTVQQNGATPANIRSQLTPSNYPDLWIWNTDIQEWERVPLTAASLPPDTLVAFRTITTPTFDSLAALNLGTTKRITLKQGWNIISIPETLTRPGTETFLLDDNLLDCTTNQQASIIANYHPENQVWYIWLPCNPQTETTYTTGPQARHNKLAHISRTHPVYLCLLSPTPVEITWNPDTLRYITQNNPTTQFVPPDSSRTVLTNNVCSR